MGIGGESGGGKKIPPGANPKKPVPGGGDGAAL